MEDGAKQQCRGIFRSYSEKVVNTLLTQELTGFLDYKKYDCTLQTEYGDLKLEIPLDCNGDFYQQTIAPYKLLNIQSFTCFKKALR